MTSQIANDDYLDRVVEAWNEEFNRWIVYSEFVNEVSRAFRREIRRYTGPANNDAHFASFLNTPNADPSCYSVEWKGNRSVDYVEAMLRTLRGRACARAALECK
jgi:hypothetical protein